MPPEKIIEKARKLMAMTTENGASEHEAYTAAVRLQELLDKHNLSMAGISKENLAKKIEFHDIEYPTSRKDHAFIELAHSVAYGYGSEVIIRKKGIQFIGVSSSAIISSEMFSYLWGVLNKIATTKAREYNKKGAQIKSFKHAFILGAAGEIFSRFYLVNQEKISNTPMGVCVDMGENPTILKFVQLQTLIIIFYVLGQVLGLIRVRKPPSNSLLTSKFIFP